MTTFETLKLVVDDMTTADDRVSAAAGDILSDDIPNAYDNLADAVSVLVRAANRIAPEGHGLRLEVR